MKICTKYDPQLFFSWWEKNSLISFLLLSQIFALLHRPYYLLPQLLLYFNNSKEVFYCFRYSSGQDGHYAAAWRDDKCLQPSELTVEVTVSFFMSKRPLSEWIAFSLKIIIFNNFFLDISSQYFPWRRSSNAKLQQAVLRYILMYLDIGSLTEVSR